VSVWYSVVVISSQWLPISKLCCSRRTHSLVAVPFFCIAPPPPIFSTMHFPTKKFGHISNITSVISGNKEMGKDYLVGILSASVAMIIFFVVWMAMIAIFKVLGPKRVGFLSGKSVRRPMPVDSSVFPPADGKNREVEGAGDGDGDDLAGHEDCDREKAVAGRDDTEYFDSADATEYHETAEGVKDLDGPGAEAAVLEEVKGKEYNQHSAKLEEDTTRSRHDQDYEIWTEQAIGQERRLRRIRVVICACGLAIFILCILLVTMGIRSLTRSLTNARVGLSNTEDLALAGVVLIDSYVMAQNETFSIAQNIDDQAVCAPLGDLLCQILVPGASNAEECIPGTEEVQSFVAEVKDLIGNELFR